MSYNLLNPVHVITAGDMSQATLTSRVVEIKLQDNIGIELVWTGAPVGAFDFQISMNHLEDSQGNVITAGNWISLPLSPPISAVGAGDSAYVDLNQMSATYFRLVYTKTSGTGSLDVYVNGKGV